MARPKPKPSSSGVKPSSSGVECSSAKEYAMQGGFAGVVCLQTMLMYMSQYYFPATMSTLLGPDEFDRFFLEDVYEVNSYYFLFGALGCVTCIPFYKYSRKRMLYFTIILSTLSWFLLFYASSSSDVTRARCLSGLASGMHMVFKWYYHTECVLPFYKEHATLKNCFASTAGLVTIIILGAFFHWRTIAGFMLCVHALSLMTMLSLQESPYYIQGLSRNANAKQVLKNYVSLQGKSFDEHCKTIKRDLASERANKGLTKWLYGGKDRINCLLYLVCQQLTGINVYLSFLPKMLEYFLTQSLSTPLIAIVLILLYGSSFLKFNSFIPMHPRRELMLAATSKMGLANIAFGIALLCFHFVPWLSLMGVAALCCILHSFMSRNFVGIDLTAYLVYSESLSYSEKIHGTPSIFFAHYLTIFVLVNFFPLTVLGVGCYIGLCGLLSLLGYVIIDYYTFETNCRFIES